MGIPQMLNGHWEVGRTEHKAAEFAKRDSCKDLRGNETFEAYTKNHAGHRGDRTPRSLVQPRNLAMQTATALDVRKPIQRNRHR